jgi:hypothetical protein
MSGGDASGQQRLAEDRGQKTEDGGNKFEAGFH